MDLLVTVRRSFFVFSEKKRTTECIDLLTPKGSSQLHGHLFIYTIGNLSMWPSKSSTSTIPPQRICSVRIQRNRCRCNPRRIKFPSFPSSMVCATFCLFFRHKFLTDMHPIPSVLLFFPSRLCQVYHLSPFNHLHYRHSRPAHPLHLRYSQRITTTVSTHRNHCRNRHSYRHLYLECIHPQARPSTPRSGSQGSCPRCDPRTGDHQSAAWPGNDHKTLCHLPIIRIHTNRQLTY